MRLKIIFLFTLNLFCQTVICQTANENVFTNKETLFSTRNGKQIGELTLSIEIKSLEANPKEFYLIIGEKTGDIITGAKDKTLWFFSKNTNVNQLKKDLKKKDYTLEVKDFRELTQFSENEISFELKEWDEINRQTKIPFFTDAASGKEIYLKLQFYIASVEKKKTVINDDAKVIISFIVPSNIKEKQQAKALEAMSENAGGGGGGGGAPAEMTAEEKEEQLKREKEAERIKRTNDLNVFITAKNKEIAALMEEINKLMETKEAKYTIQTIDSLELVINEMQKKVDYYDKGYTDILLNEEAIQDKFLKFGTDKIIITKKLAEMRQKLLDKPNLLKIIGIGFAALMAGWMFIMQILNPIKIKKQIKKQQQMMEAEARKKAFESININDLHKI